MNGGKICVSVRAGSPEQLLRDIRLAGAHADIIEIRLDYAPAGSAISLVEGLPDVGPPYLLTFRPSEQGGGREISTAERMAFWSAVRAGGRDFLIDVEHDITVDGADLVSYHNFEQVPAALDAIYERLRANAPKATIKIACTVQTVTDAIPVFGLLARGKKDGLEVIPIAMGEAGEWTRILGPAHGAAMTYASPDDGNATAPGQITSKEMVERYRVRELTRQTKVYAIIGDPVSRSMSPVIHNPAFQAAAEDCVFIKLPVVNIEEFMRRMVVGKTREVELNFAGFAVTMPHKQSIIPYLDELDETSAAVGAVNTVKVTRGELKGYNTDVRGFIEPLKRQIGDLNSCRVAVFGSGGAARACVYGLMSEGAEVTVLARDARKAENLAGEFNARAGQLDSIDGVDVFVNATPIGMNHAEATPFGSNLISNLKSQDLKVVYDLVTSREDTSLIREGKLAGVTTICGEQMLLEQGAAQFEIWTAREAPRQAMAEALANL